MFEHEDQALMTAVGLLNPGCRFEVTQYPEGCLTGEVELAHGEYVEVYIDGDEGLSCWPKDTRVRPL